MPNRISSVGFGGSSLSKNSPDGRLPDIDYTRMRTINLDEWSDRPLFSLNHSQYWQESRPCSAAAQSQVSKCLSSNPKVSKPLPTFDRLPAMDLPHIVYTTRDRLERTMSLQQKLYRIRLDVLTEGGLACAHRSQQTDPGKAPSKAAGLTGIRCSSSPPTTSVKSPDWSLSDLHSEYERPRWTVYKSSNGLRYITKRSSRGNHFKNSSLHSNLNEEHFICGSPSKVVRKPLSEYHKWTGQRGTYQETKQNNVIPLDKGFPVDKDQRMVKGSVTTVPPNISGTLNSPHLLFRRRQLLNWPTSTVGGATRRTDAAHFEKKCRTHISSQPGIRKREEPLLCVFTI